MENHPNLSSLFKLVEDIQDLQKAKDLLREIWLSDSTEANLPLQLRFKLDDYFEVDDSE